MCWSRVRTMSAETVDSHPLLRRLNQALTSCSASIESGDFKQSTESITELAEFLSSVAEDAVSEPDNEILTENASVVVTHIHQYIKSPSLHQAVVDALSFELPKAVARFACVSQRCFEIAECIIDGFIEICGPRDMLSILCEALDSPCTNFKVPGYYAPLVSGIAKDLVIRDSVIGRHIFSTYVSISIYFGISGDPMGRALIPLLLVFLFSVLILIQRRQFEQLKEAVPILVKVLKTVLTESDEEETNFENVLERSVDVASSIKLLCEKLEGKVNEKLRALLGLYVLEIMALLSFGTNFNAPSRLCLAQQLSHFLQYCDLSYIGLITGCDVDKISTTLAGDYGDDGKSCFSYTKHGASLAVIRVYISKEIAEASGENLAAVITELSSNHTKRWQTLGILRYMLTCSNLSWELKKQAINFLLSILDGKISPECNNEIMECSSYTTNLFSALKAVEMVIMYAPDPTIKKNAFDAFKKVLADIPASPRFDTLMALINNSDSSSMTAILIDCVRNEMRMENCQRITTENPIMHAENNANQSTSFWNAGILELVALILRPPKGGPPSLPEFGDAVLSALNLYRYVLMTESLGNSNRTGVLSRTNLEKAYNKWLLPLRTLVTGIMTENKKDGGDFSLDIICGLNPIELVLYRCIELIEERL